VKSGEIWSNVLEQSTLWPLRSVESRSRTLIGFRPFSRALAKIWYFARHVKILGRDARVISLKRGIFGGNALKSGVAERHSVCIAAIENVQPPAWKCGT
jgi:hypothetical protein